MEMHLPTHVQYTKVKKDVPATGEGRKRTSPSASPVWATKRWRRALPREVCLGRGGGSIMWEGLVRFGWNGLGVGGFGCGVFGSFGIWAVAERVFINRLSQLYTCMYMYSHHVPASLPPRFSLQSLQPAFLFR